MDAPEWVAVQPPGEDDTTLVLRQRLRAALLCCLAPIALFAAFDLSLAAPERLPIYFGVKLLAVAVAVGGFLSLGAPRRRPAVIGLALLCIAGMYALSSLSAILAGETATTPILSVAVALGTATLLPWGPLPQLAVVAIAALATAVTVYGAAGSLAPLLAYQTVGMLIGFGLSVYVASEFDRSRRALARRLEEQRRAEAEVRELNEALEARVATRTAALQRSEASLSALIENTHDAIWSVDRQYHITAFNSVAAERFRAVFGYPMRVGMGRDDARIREHFDGAWKAYYDRGLAGERFSVEHALEMPDGVRHFHVFFNPIVSDGAVTGVAIFSSDVTERRRAEAAARQHQAELTHVLRLSTMGEMAAGLAHEINQPLGAIVSYAQGTARRLRADPEAVGVVLPIIDDIAAEALRAGEVIRRLRSLVRKEAPRQELVDVAELVRDAVRLVEPEARDCGVAVRVEPVESLPAVLGDRIQIEQVLLNLLRNGVEAMADLCDRRELVIAVSLAGESIEVAVGDTGPGLAPAIAERVFDAFVSTKPGGLGMGLSISRTIVEAHRGRLWATANPGGGTTFRFTLPLAASPALATAM